MKKAIVVGASSGIGHEVARLLIAQGWAVGVARVFTILYGRRCRMMMR